MVRTGTAQLVTVLTALLLLLPAVPASASGDPLVGAQWSLQQINAPQAWSTTRGAGVTIAIIDSGIDLGHEDLAGKVVAGNTFVDCGDSGCGDGGWTTGGGEPSPHGTHVAGIAGARTGNGIGIAGTAPDTRLLAVKVLTEDGGRMADLAHGIRYATDNGARVINLSLAWPVGIGQTLRLTGNLGPVEDAIRHAHDRGVVIVASSGNDGGGVGCNEPAGQPGVICVTATDRAGNRAPYANVPRKPDRLGLAAPGGAGPTVWCHDNVISTVPAGHGTTRAACDDPPNGAYREYAGTSMAAPHVSGVAALLLALGCSREQTIDLLTSTARPPGSGARGQWSETHGYGIVDAKAAVDEASRTCGTAPAPSAPSDSGSSASTSGTEVRSGGTQTGSSAPRSTSPPPQPSPEPQADDPDDEPPTVTDDTAEADETEAVVEADLDALAPDGEVTEDAVTPGPDETAGRTRTKRLLVAAGLLFLTSGVLLAVDARRGRVRPWRASG